MTRRLEPGLAVASAVLLLLVATASFFAWAGRHLALDGRRLTPAQSELVLGIASFPSRVNDARWELSSWLLGRPEARLRELDDLDTSHWSAHFPEPSDPGFLLIAGVSAGTPQPDVRLLRIADGVELARWDPPWEDILSRSVGPRKDSWTVSLATVMPVNPLLLPDGDIVFTTGASLVRLAACTSAVRWVAAVPAHHSVTLGDTDTLWVPSISDDGTSLPDSWLEKRIRNDSLAEFAQDGRVLRNISVLQILRQNRLLAAAMVSLGGRLHSDPLHLNQIDVAYADGIAWKAGDLLVSLRNLNMVLLYRPSTGAVIWHRTGPWINQHDAEFVDDRRISVFDNNSLPAAPEPLAFVEPPGGNRVWTVDLGDGLAEQPYAQLLLSSRPASVTEGRARILPDGGLFIEDSNNGRMLRYKPTARLWERINNYDTKNVGLHSWSRYLTAEEVSTALLRLRASGCNLAG